MVESDSKFLFQIRFIQEGSLVVNFSKLIPNFKLYIYFICSRPDSSIRTDIVKRIAVGEELRRAGRKVSTKGQPPDSPENIFRSIEHSQEYRT